MALFENETFEVDGEERIADVIEVTPELPVFDKETGEVTEDVVMKGTVGSVAKALSKRVKRTEQQMIQSFNGNSMRESVYVLERISKLEDKMSELLNSVGTKAQAMIVSERPELSRFVK